MRIGVSGGGATVDRAVDQAIEAERDGFATLWYPGSMFGDPLVAMALAGRATERVEIGVAVVQTFGSHPLLQATRIGSVAAAVARGVTVTVGPSHDVAIERLGISYEHAGRHTEEYMRILSPLLRGEEVTFHGEDFHLDGGRVELAAPVSLFLSALGNRMLRVAGELADGTVLWMANARAIESHIVPRITGAATAAGRPAPRIVAGLPVAVHDDVDEARAAAAEQFAIYGKLPNYLRIIGIGGISSPAEAVLVGTEEQVLAQMKDAVAAGATDLWTPPFPVGSDRSGSRARTRAFLSDVARAGVHA
jgi:F420-dependent oxidoreductase-like protein